MCALLRTMTTNTLCHPLHEHVHTSLLYLAAIYELISSPTSVVLKVLTSKYQRYLSIKRRDGYASVTLHARAVAMFTSSQRPVPSHTYRGQTQLLQYCRLRHTCAPVDGGCAVPSIPEIHTNLEVMRFTFRDVVVAESSAVVRPRPTDYFC